jgi:hypothetical protein
MELDNIDCICQKIIKIIKNSEKKTPLKKIIDDVKNQNEDIDTKTIFDKIKSTNPDLISYQLNNNHYYIIRKDQTDEHELKERTRIITYSLLIILNFFFIINMHKEYANIIIPSAFLIIYISQIFINNKNMTFLFYIISMSILFYSQNYTIIITAILLYIIYEILKNIVKKEKTEKTEMIEFVLTVASLFIVGMTVNLSEYYMDVKFYMLSKSLFILMIIILFIWKNKFNIIHTSLFLAISFSAYNLLSNIMKTLNDKNIIFYPYNESFNFNFSIVSIAITILLFSIPSIIYFIKVVVRTTDIKFNWPIILLSIVGSLILLALSLAFTILKIVMTVFLIFLSLLLFIAILLNENENLPTWLKKIVFFNKFFFSKDNTVNFKSLKFIENFYKPLQINKKLPFNKEAYLENFSFIMLSILIIFSFIFSYNDIYHFKENKGTPLACDNIPEHIFYTNTEDKSYVYALYEIPQEKDEASLIQRKKIIDESIHSFKLKMQNGNKLYKNKEQARRMFIIKEICSKTKKP